MKMAQSLLLFLLLISQTSQSMLIPAILPAIKYVPMAMATAGYLAVTYRAWMRGKDLAAIQSKIDVLQQGVDHLKDAVASTKNKLDKVDSMMITVVTDMGTIQVSLGQVADTLEEQGSQIVDLGSKHDRLHDALTQYQQESNNHFEQLTQQGATLFEKIDLEAAKSLQHTAHFESKVSKLSQQIEELTREFADLKKLFATDSEAHQQRYQDVSTQLASLHQRVETLDTRGAAALEIAEKTHGIVNELDRVNKVIMGAGSQASASVPTAIARNLFGAKNKHIAQAPHNL